MLSKEDIEMLEYIQIFGDSWKSDFARNILNKGWISDKQKIHLIKCYCSQKRAMTIGSSYDIDCHASGSYSGYTSHPGQFDGRY